MLVEEGSNLWLMKCWERGKSRDWGDGSPFSLCTSTDLQFPPDASFLSHSDLCPQGLRLNFWSLCRWREGPHFSSEGWGYLEILLFQSFDQFLCFQSDSHSGLQPSKVFSRPGPVGFCKVAWASFLPPVTLCSCLFSAKSLSLLPALSIF